MIKRIAALLASLCSSVAMAGAACQGAFPNLITDICYDCMFPVILSGGLLNFGISGEDYDTGAGKLPVCLCINGLTAGTPLAFWEPRFMVDVTNKPGCMPLLGGVDIDPPYNAAEYGSANGVSYRIVNGRTKSAFMHVNEYINPVMTAIGAITQTPCLDSRSFDVPYVSWADPTWNDDMLSMIIAPYAYPFASVLSIATEAPDAISATFGFGIPEFFWVAGAWGPMYPLTGNIAAASTPEQISHLMIARIFAKLHAAGTQQTVAGNDALQSCGALGFPELIMDKRQYKTNRTFPFPDNMCTPFGRPLLLQETLAARPQDKDYGYFIFQRKDCCAPLVGAQ